MKYWPHVHEVITDINGPQRILNDFGDYLTFQKLIESKICSGLQRMNSSVYGDHRPFYCSTIIRTKCQPISPFFRAGFRLCLRRPFYCGVEGVGCKNFIRSCVDCSENMTPVLLFTLTW